MHKYLSQYPKAHIAREEEARQMFPYKEMCPEKYAALTSHDWLCFSYDNYTYSDQELNEWIHSLGDIFFTEGAIIKARLKYLTEEEIRHAEYIDNNP